MKTLHWPSMEIHDEAKKAKVLNQIRLKRKCPKCFCNVRGVTDLNRHMGILHKEKL